MESPNTPKVFITHSWSDIDIARKLYDDLVAHGYQVWFDDKTLKGGHRMAEEINRGLEWCDAYLPILSPQALESPWCWEEINAAISLSNEKERAGRPRVIPILAQNCQVPAILRGRLYISLAEQYSREIARVYSAIDTFRLDSERKQREQMDRERAAQLAREKAEQVRLAKIRAEEERLAKKPALAEKLRYDQVERFRLAGEKQTALQSPAWIRATEQDNPKSKAKTSAILKKFSIPIIIGNIACVASYVVLIFLPSSLHVSIFIALLFLVFFVMGIFSAASHKQSTPDFLIRQSVEDGLWGGVISSIFITVVALCIVPLSLVSSIANGDWTGFFVFAGAVVVFPLSAAFAGAIGGGGWGIIYMMFFAGRRQ